MRFLTIKHSLRGSITLEAAIVVPIFLMILLALLGLIQRIYIHEKIQYALDETLQQMTITSYIMEELEITSKLSTSYQSARIEESKFYPYISGTQAFIEQLNGQKDKLSGFALSKTSVNIQDPQNINVANFEQLYVVMNEVIEGILYLTEDVDKLFANMLKAKGIEILNAYITASLTKGMFYDHFDDASLLKLGVKNGMSGLNFSKSSALLEDKYIHLIVEYQLGDNVIDPLGGLIGIDTLIIQEAHGRAFIGQGLDFSKVKQSEKLDDGRYVYIAASLKGECYHVLECLQVPMTQSYYQDEQHRQVCEVCLKKVGLSRDGDSVWYPTGSATAKIHFDSRCYTMYVPADKILFDEAILQYRPCKKCIKD